MTYDGTQLQPLFNYKTFNVQGDSICAFIGEMNVNTNHLVDMEDVKGNDYIWSPCAINFLVEIFHINIEATVLYQRMLMQIITDTLNHWRHSCYFRSDIESIVLQGDDIMVQIGGVWYKLSVSIATVSPVSGLIHSGLNISVDDKIPVPAIGIFDLWISVKNGVEITDDKMKVFLNKVVNDVLGKFQQSVSSVKQACTKVRCLI